MPKKRRIPRPETYSALRGKPELVSLTQRLEARGAFDRLGGTYARREIRDYHAAVLRAKGVEGVAKSSLRNQSISVKYVDDELDRHTDPMYVHPLGGPGAERASYGALYMVGRKVGPGFFSLP